MNDRSANELPKLAPPKTDTLDPHRPVPIIDTELPHRANLRNDNELPK
jgi:hypothetical protein